MKTSPWFIPIFSILLASLVISACSPAQASNLQDLAIVTADPPTQAQDSVLSADPTPEVTKQATNQPEAGWPDGQAKQDAQGAIEVAIVPLNLNNPGETLDFEVSLNTHSVDLSMDLAPLATLTTDRGATVQASLWQAPSRGHHVSGTLTFPATLDGQKLLDNARQLTLTLVDLDAPQRLFIWTK